VQHVPIVGNCSTPCEGLNKLLLYRTRCEVLLWIDRLLHSMVPSIMPGNGIKCTVALGKFQVQLCTVVLQCVVLLCVVTSNRGVTYNDCLWLLEVSSFLITSTRQAGYIAEQNSTNCQWLVPTQDKNNMVGSPGAQKHPDNPAILCIVYWIPYHLTDVTTITVLLPAPQHRINWKAVASNPNNPTVLKNTTLPLPFSRGAPDPS
jgi:hypothetical protein